LTLVVDASAVVNLLLDVVRIEDQAVFDTELAAPDLLLVEVASGLRRSERRGIVSSASASSMLADLLELPVRMFPDRDLLERAFELRANVTVGDACYIALAEQLGCGLLTSDARLARSPGITVPVTVV